MTLRPRERRLALVALMVIGCWIVVSWVVQPLWEHLRTLRLEVATHAEKLGAINRLLAQAPAIERRYREMAGYLQTQDDERGQGTFLKELEVLARAANVQVNLKPRSMKPEERLNRVEVELDIEGSQPSLLGFLDALLRMPRLLTIERLRIAPVPADEHLLRSNLVLHALTLK
ncbi:MAG: type 4a pilus biogenesis protein PilO [Candidatus Omnitrophica bacterium]|nr:type 4a pilus biogenesis protein PilO [Candidatus Omnitrophota bacterium]